MVPISSHARVVTVEEIARIKSRYGLRVSGASVRQPTQIPPTGGVGRRDCGRCHGLGTATQSQRTSGMWPAEWSLIGQLWNLMTNQQHLGRDFPLPDVVQGGPKLFSMSDHDETPQDVLDALEQDLLETDGPPRPLSRGCGWQAVGVVPTVIQRHATVCARRNVRG